MSPIPLRPAEGILRVGLIGAGWVTTHHLRAWARIGTARVVAICDPDVGKARARAAEFGIESVFDDAGALFAAASIDAVDIASPRETHPDLVRQATKRGLATLCQKPFAPDLAQARSLIEDIDPAARVMVHENWRRRPYYRDIKGWLDSGRIGALRQASMTLLSSGLVADAEGTRPLLDRQPFLRTLDRMLVTEIMIHHLDTLRFLCGELTVEDAAIASTTPDIVGEDMASVLLRTEGGVRIFLMGNAAAAGFPPQLVDRLTLIGNEGSIVLDGTRLILSGAQPEECDYDAAASYQASYDSTIAHFVDALRTGEPFETPPGENLGTLVLVEEIYRQGRGRKAGSRAMTVSLDASRATDHE
jgi:predicted dehydrogenase